MVEGNPPPVNLIQIKNKDEMIKDHDLENDLKNGKFLGESLDKIESDKKDSHDLSDAMKANTLLGPVKFIISLLKLGGGSSINDVTQLRTIFDHIFTHFITRALVLTTIATKSFTNSIP